MKKLLARVLFVMFISVIVSNIGLYKVSAKEPGELVVITLTFNNGSPRESIVVPYLGSLGVLPKPVWEGYNFGGWWRYLGTRVISGLSPYPIPGYMELEDNDVWSDYYCASVIIDALDARWYPKDYTLYFNYEGADVKTGNTSKVVTYTNSVGVLPEPVKTDYTFGGWFTSRNGEGTEYVNTTEYNNAFDTSLYAYWILNKYKISFDYKQATAGNTIINKEVISGKQVGDLPVPTRKGYSFRGWWTNASGSGDNYIKTSIYTESKDIKLYAYWVPNNYKINFDYQASTGGNTVASKDVTYGKAVNNLPIPVKTGYTFAGWFSGKAGSGIEYTDVTSYSIDGNITLYANWAPNSYKINFDYQNAVDIRSTLSGNGLLAKDVTYDKSVGTLPVPSRVGYNFMGWFTSPKGVGTKYNTNTVYKNATAVSLYAYWEAKKYKLSFAYNGATEGASTVNKEIIWGQDVGTLPAPKKTGYTFNGWFNIEGEQYTVSTEYIGNVSAAESSGIMLDAVWIANSYMLNFDYNLATAGNTVANKEVVYDKILGELPEPSRIGYTFRGWLSEGITYTASTVYRVDGDKTLIAKWMANSYKINFDYQGATGNDDISDKVVVYDLQVGELPNPSKIGYTFKGWNSAPRVNEETYTANTVYKVAGVTILYAVWEANNYKIIFDYNNADSGNTVASKEVIFDLAIGELPVPARIGYTFKGWMFGSVEYVAEGVYKVDGDLPLVAKWEANGYRIEFDYQNATSGNLVLEEDVIYDSQVGELPEPRRIGYTFQGWYIEVDGKGEVYKADRSYKVAGDLILYAYWIANNYKITLDYQGGNRGNNVAEFDVTYDSPINLLQWGTAVGELSVEELPINIGYVFTGWFTEPKGQGVLYKLNDIYKVPNDITLYAKWDWNGRTKLAFDYQDATAGNELQGKKVLYGLPVEELPNPTRIGYTFNGWFTASAGRGTLYTQDTIYLIDDETVLYAYWVGNPYKLTFDYQEATSGNSLEQKQVIYGDAVGELPNPTRIGYTFNGWYTQLNAVGVEYTVELVYQTPKDIILYAAWTANKYTLTFGYENANTLGVFSKEVIYDSILGELPIPERTGYIFSGWYTLQNGKGIAYNNNSLYDVADGLTVYAYWTTTEQPQIILDYQMGTGRAGIIQKDVIYGKRIGILPTPVWEGYIFNGWYTEPKGFGEKFTSETVYDLKETITLYASWLGNEFNIIFDYQGADSGVTDYSKPIVAGQVLGDLPKPGKNGLVFGGWFEQPFGKGKHYESYSIYDNSKDLTLYAYWVGIIFDYQFEDEQDSTPKEVDQDKPIGKDVTPGQPIGRLPKPSRPGYIFIGWNTDADGTGKMYDEGTEYASSDGNTLYAIWEAEKYNLYFDYQGADTGVGLVSKEVTFEQPVGELYRPVRSGYNFSGWFTLPNGHGKLYQSTTIYTNLGDTTLYALWRLVNGSGIPQEYETDTGTGSDKGLGVDKDLSSGSDKDIEVGSGSEFGFDKELGSNSGTTSDSNSGTTSGSNSGTTSGSNSGTTSGSNSGTTSGSNRAEGFEFELGRGTGVGSEGVQGLTEEVNRALGVSGGYTIVFDYQGADGGNSLGSKEIMFGESVGMLPHPIKVGYGFGGWYLKPNGEGVWYPSERSYENNSSLTLFAYWRPRVIQIIFDYQEGVTEGFVTGKDVLYESPAGVLPNPIREGYKFLGWFTLPGGQGEVYTESTVITSIKPVHVYAYWMRV